MAGDGCTLRFADPLARLAVALRWRLLPSGLLSARAELLNEGNAPVRVHWLAALALPLPGWASDATQVHGRWSGEFGLARAPLATGKLEKVGRAGRTGFDGAAYLLVGDARLSEERGRCFAAHLAWSGNARSFCEALPSGERQLQIGEALAPGEVSLRPGERHETPEALVAFSAQGLNGVRRAYHAELRVRRAAAGVGVGPRRVHFNSWEAAWFDFDEPRLLELARDAAALGAGGVVVGGGGGL